MKLNLRRFASYPAPLRILSFVLLLLAVWVPFAAPVYALVPDPNWQSLLTMPVLYGQFLWLVGVWGRRVYGEAGLLGQYGLQLSRANGQDLALGLAIGYGSLFSLFSLEGLLGWIVWRSPVLSWVRLIPEALLISLLIGFAEETFFRGWLLDELERDYRPAIALWINAILFALVHFIKPLEVLMRLWWTFPGLVLLGLALVWGKRRSRHPASMMAAGRLGLPMGLHGGLVGGFYMINVGQLVRYTGQVPPWVTGLDNNPLASALGVTFLAAIALAMYYLSHPSQRAADRNKSV